MKGVIQSLDRVSGAAEQLTHHHTPVALQLWQRHSAECYDTSPAATRQCGSRRKIEVPAQQR
ncbi:hypothetical protein RIEGSTA812A_PEG_518 [invertebrate metagenome]|uniref:Uncharacterized protein n=1 Tax=invertebrate metagenome TaxID=1711999 RepID=A0A484H6R1_9ZZZZ